MFISSLHSPKISRFIYRTLVEKISTHPTAIARCSQYNFCNNLNWHSIFSLPFKTARNMKVIYLQLRFLHRILGVNYLLHKMKLSDPLCSFCSNEEETLLHLFYECNYVRKFWEDVSKNCIRNGYNFCAADICFGRFSNINHPINFLILYAKHYIFSCKSYNTIPDACTFY